MDTTFTFFALTSTTWDGLSDGVAILIIAVLLLVGLSMWLRMGMMASFLPLRVKRIIIKP